MTYKIEAPPPEMEPTTEPTSSYTLPTPCLGCEEISSPSYAERPINIHSRIWTHQSKNDVGFPFVFQRSSPINSIALVPSSKIRGT